MTSHRFIPLTIMTFCGALQGVQSHRKTEPIQWKYLLPVGLVSSYLAIGRIEYLVEKEGTPSMKQMLAKRTPGQIRVGFFLGGLILNACYGTLGYCGGIMLDKTFKTLE